jgi:hypothetical protein
VLDALLVGGLGAGVGTALHGATAFTGGTVPRNSTVNVAPDGSAILGLSIADSVQRKTQTLLAELTNNGTESYTLTISLDDPTQGTLYGPNGSGDSVTLTLDPGTTGSIDVETDEQKGTTIPFTISRSAPDFSFSIDRATRVKGGFEEPVALELSGSVSSPGKGNSGKFRFTLENTGDVDVELLEIGIVETTNPMADFVTGNGSLYDRDSGTEYVTDRISIDSSTSGSTLRAMDPSPVLDYQTDGDDDSKLLRFEFDKFRSDSQGGNVNMRGEDVKIELRVRNVRDGTISTGTVDLCSGQCDF